MPVRNAVLLLVLTLACLPAGAQKIRFSDPANRWTVEHSGGGTPPDYWQIINRDLRLGPDTMIGGRRYRQLVDSTGFGSTRAGFGGFYREDTLSGKVWSLSESVCTGGDVEMLIYNPEWRIGDTVYHCPSALPPVVSTIHSFDSIRIDGIFHRLVTIWTTNSSTSRFHIVEGIGSTFGPAFPQQPSTFENQSRLRCFSRNGLRPAISYPAGIQDHFDNSQSCEIIRLQVAKAGATEEPVVIPNPGRGEVRLRIPAGMQASVLILYDALGRVIHCGPVRGPWMELRPYLRGPGAYAYTLSIADAAKPYRGRFVVVE